MELVWGSLAWLAGTVQYTVAFHQMSRANPDEKIPQIFGLPRNHPGEIYVYRAVAVMLLMLSFFAWADLLGYWGVLLILSGTIPAAVLNARHNGRVHDPRSTNRLG
ncbi:hypothetical protein [Dietzia sp. PP-33]|jgi:hypothetical protein|uniref:hypothetical protein n=1 Tax=Dietzia sp. PP-33 TaxID=2957500 RepID=UPI0029B0C607|nr:hypothetical protein [Dietzia sp. PP-33]MDX2358529.1 hypothetical protein [Dietzia sp. PP-33]